QPDSCADPGDRARRLRVRRRHGPVHEPGIARPLLVVRVARRHASRRGGDVIAHTHAAGPIGVAPLTLMWFGMMAAMMAPTVWPWVRSFPRFGSARASTAVATAQFAAGYLVAWLGYSIVAALAQRALQTVGAVDHATAVVSARTSAVAFLIAGLYQ